MVVTGSTGTQGECCSISRRWHCWKLLWGVRQGHSGSAAKITGRPLALPEASGGFLRLDLHSCVADFESLLSLIVLSNSPQEPPQVVESSLCFAVVLDLAAESGHCGVSASEGMRAEVSRGNSMLQRLAQSPASTGRQRRLQRVPCCCSPCSHQL